MTGRVEGKVALVTGAARGQGRAYALRLAEEGADIIAIDICAPVRGVRYAPATSEDLADTAREVQALGRRVVASIVDTRDLAALTASVDDGVTHLGGLHIVVANAGICIPAVWDKVSEQNFRDTIDVNVVGTWNTVVATVPKLITSGGGSIVLISSSAGLKALPFMTPYVASKHAITGLGRAFAAELAQHNIRVNTLHPTGVDTEMGAPQNQAVFAAALQANPALGGMLVNMLPVESTQPIDQANAVLFLASEESRYITATALAVDAGNSQY